MNPAKQLVLNIQTCEIPHAKYTTILDHLVDRISDALEGMRYQIEAVVGPSRVGKSMLINALSAMHPQSKINGRRTVPVLRVALPSLVSPKELPLSMLNALGVPMASRALDRDMNKQMNTQLDAAENRVILVEEASHSVEKSSRIDPHAAADWWKSFAERRNATVIMFGVPRLLRLFDSSNDQLRLRAAVPLQFRPYDWSVKEEQEQFAVCVLSYAELFAKAGWPIAIDVTALICNCYLFCAGTIGVLSSLMESVANSLRSQPFREVTFTDFQVAAGVTPSAGDPTFPAFQSNGVVSPVALMAAHICLLKRYDLSPRSSTNGKTPGASK